MCPTGLPDFSWYKNPKVGKIYQSGYKKYQMAIKCTKMVIEIPNGHELHQNFTSQGLTKYTKVGIFGMKLYHLANLANLGILSYSLVCFKIGTGNV
jgi:hypothetical protein